MAQFHSPLEVRHVGEQQFMLLSHLRFENDKYFISIYPGFGFDGASIPKSLWSLIGCPMGGLYSSAACIHDALYASHLLNKKTSDKIFHEAMIASGVDMVLAKEMYLAVRSFGDSAYNSADNLPKYRDLVKIDVK